MFHGNGATVVGTNYRLNNLDLNNVVRIPSSNITDTEGEVHVAVFVVCVLNDHSVTMVSVVLYVF